MTKRWFAGFLVLAALVCLLLLVRGRDFFYCHPQTATVIAKLGFNSEPPDWSGLIVLKHKRWSWIPGPTFLTDHGEPFVPTPNQDVTLDCGCRIDDSR